MYNIVNSILSVCGRVHLKIPLESIKMRKGLSPRSRFLSLANMSITVTKGDVKLHSTNLSVFREVINICTVFIQKNTFCAFTGTY